MSRFLPYDRHTKRDRMPPGEGSIYFARGMQARRAQTYQSRGRPNAALVVAVLPSE